MTNIDRKLIDRKLEALKDYLEKLRELQSLDRKTFLSDHRNFGLAEHYLQLAIEIVLDVSRHLVITLELRTPDDSSGLLPLLQEAKVLSPDFVQRNLKMPGFRNALVHVYEQIDHKRTYQYLQEHLADFELFIKQISKYLLKHK